MKKAKSPDRPKPDVKLSEDSSASSSARMSQEHARIKSKPQYKSFLSPYISGSDASTSVSITSLSSSISRFRTDFEELKCKMRVFGESLNLCRCMADDFKNKLAFMEKRLQSLEKRHILWRSESNYSAIIQKNKRLSHKAMQDAKKLQMCGTEAEMREVAARICRNYLHGAWKSVDPTELEFRRISGGLSNFLYYVALPEDPSKLCTFTKRESSPETELETAASKLVKKSMARSNSFSIEEPKKVLLRIYGQVHGERAMDAIVTESVIFTLLSERRLGPKLHGVFSGGRIEEYIPARPLLTRELAEPALSMKIAEKMAAIHSMDIPLSKEPNWLWKTMWKWLKICKDERLNTVGKNEEEQRIIKQLKSIDFNKEIDWLKKFLATVESPVVFCHNDMQEGNILMLEDSANADDEMTTIFQAYDVEHHKSSKENYHLDEISSDSISSHISDSGEPKLFLIDFEYCAYNHRGFDIANHFQEWAYDYTNDAHPFYHECRDDCPTLEQKQPRRP